MRTLSEIQADILIVKAQLQALPDSAVRMGLDEDYRGDLESLEDEAKQVETEGTT